MAGFLVGLNINDVAAETFSGNASTTAFTLAVAGTTNTCGVYILGVHQVPTTDYSVSGTTLTFTAAPPTGTNNICVVYTKPQTVGAPADATVTTAKLSGDLTLPGKLTAAGDTAASDNASMGYTSAEGLILTGQGSTNDVTIKNDADADVITIATGGTAVDVVGALTAGTITSDAGISGTTGTFTSTVDINGAELILDANANTSITADTDDQIDIKIAGADDFQFTANTFNILSGSTLAVNSGATIANSGTATGFGGLIAAATLTLSSGVIAPTGSGIVTITSESGASDTLTTITAWASITPGDSVYIRPTSGDNITVDGDSTGNIYLRDGLDLILFLDYPLELVWDGTDWRQLNYYRGFRGAIASRGSAQSVAHATLTTVTWDNTVFDTQSIHSEGTNPSRLTIPTGVTQVRIVAFYYIAWNISKAQGVHFHSSRLNKNGSFHAYGNYYYVDTGSTNYGFMFGAEWPVINCAPGDYFETMVKQDTGHAANVSGTGDAGDGFQGSHIMLEILK